jgi:cystathionine beta-synthase
MQVFSNILEMVGRTPMLEVTHIDTGPCRLFLKLELANPGGSIKDRIGVSMIGEAESAAISSPATPLLKLLPAIPALDWRWLRNKKDTP